MSVETLGHVAEQRKRAEDTRRELSAEILRMRLELELISKRLEEANHDVGARTRAFHYAQQHLDSVWRACDYALQCFETTE